MLLFYVNRTVDHAKEGYDVTWRIEKRNEDMLDAVSEELRQVDNKCQRLGAGSIKKSMF